MSLLTVADVAKIRGTDPAAAWRWLSRNAGRHFLRRGRFRAIDAEVYRRLAMADYIDDKIARVEAELSDLDDRVAEQTRRLDALATRVANLRIR